MESTGRRELRHPPSTNTRYSTTLDNVKNSNEQDVHEPVIVPGMDNMKIQDNRGMDDSEFNFLRTRA